MTIIFSVVAQKTTNEHIQSSSFESPNFNYPKTVISNAEKALKTAIKNGNSEDVALAIIQSGIAQSLISSDSLPAIITKIQTIATKENNKCIKSVLFLLEADILNSYYHRNQYIISKRNNLDITASSNVFEWDSNQFKNKISNLLDSALYQKQALLSTPITNYPHLIQTNQISISTYPTIWDFIAYKSIDIYTSWDISSNTSPIMRGASATQNKYYTKVLNIYHILLSSHKEGSRPYINAKLAELRFIGKDNEQQLDSLYKIYQGNPDSAPILLELASKVKDDKEKYQLYKYYLNKFSPNDYTDLVLLRCISLETPSEKLSFKRQYTTTDSIKMQCDVQNTHAITVAIYAIKNNENITRNKDFLKSSPVFKKEYQITGEIPFSKKINITIPPLTFGKYTAIAYSDYEQLNDSKYYKSFIVSDITSFCIDNYKDKTRRIVTVQASTGKPYAGVKIVNKPRNKEKQHLSQTTGNNGYIDINGFNFTDFNFSKGKDNYYSTSFYQSYINNIDNTKFSSNAHIFTDLAIYRPGDTIHFSAVCYQVNAIEKRLMKNESFKVLFSDSNRDSISSIDIKSDNMGRIAHNFIIPTDRMNGNFSINVRNVKNNEVLGSNIIVVSDYKAPTFYIDFIDKKDNYSDSGDITLKGIVKTFSDMPIANAEVKCSLEKCSFWYYDFNNLAEITTVTDKNGEFSLTLNATEIKNKETNGQNYYRLSATVTDKIGETQKGSMNFCLGSPLSIKWNQVSNETLSILAGENVNLPIEVISLSQNNPKDYKCILSLKDNYGKTVLTSSFLSSKPDFNFNNIESGEYSLHAYIEQDTSINIKDKKIIIYRNSDKSSPVNGMLWTPQTTFKCKPGEKISILLGNSFNRSHVYYVINYQNKILKEGWFILEKGLTPFNYQLPSKAESDIIIQLYGIKDMIQYKCNIKITPEKEQKITTLRTESFRDKIIANDTEQWTLHLAVNGQPVANGAVLGVLTDKAINLLKDNKWTFSPELLHLSTFPSLKMQQINNLYNSFYSNKSFNELKAKLREKSQIRIPELQLYGQRFFANRVFYSLNRSFQTLETVAQDIKYKDNQQAISYSVGNSLSSDNGDFFSEETSSIILNEEKSITNELSTVQLRSNQIKTAFWKPLLSTDGKGNVSINFTVPNINTTWLFQAVGYNQTLETASLLKEVISNKPIMVNSNMPRFLRQGDKAQLMADIQNATDSVQEITAIIEIFNPFNKLIYDSQKSFITLTGKETQTVAINYCIPDTLDAIGFRIKALSGRFSDGEQVLVPVLPNISPIIKSTPFYINQGDNSYKITLSDLPKNARITFEYCDNPIWYVALALPSIQSNDNTTSIQLAHSVFANITAQKIIADNPVIHTALNYWKLSQQDSALISMLAKNQDVKIGTLLASPWLNNSEEQTLRMHEMSNLFNSEKANIATDKIIDKLSELQQQDGGFAWFKYPGAVSSVHTTLNILQILGKARSINPEYKNDKLNKIISDGVKYLDKSIIEKYNKQNDKLKFNNYCNFAYTRSFFKDIKMSITVNELYKKIIQSISQEWETMNIVNKAYAVITLAQFDKTEQARPILESINQFSVYSPSTGRFWDNLQDGWISYYNKVALTSLVLQSYQKIAPQSTEVEQIRQWLLLEKQTTDWGNSSLAADAVYAILSYGTNMLNINKAPRFSINGNKFELNSLDWILGYGKTQLNSVIKSSSDTILITRDATTPAWGAIYCQYNAPIRKIKAASVPSLSITKKILNYEKNKEFKIGDKVQIQFVIKNNRNLEFVTVCDNRPACLEPTNQISEYKHEDGIGYYLEIKDTQTNLFFNYLPKGTHIITYDAYITCSGTFSSGTASAQCQYAPQIIAHSDGSVISIK